MIRVINLDRSPDRIAALAPQLDALGLAWQRLRAVEPDPVDWRDLTDVARTRRYYNRDLTRGETGCFLSHCKALREFLDSGDERCLVLEDDVVTLPDTAATLAALPGVLATPEARGWHCANLSSSYGRRRSPIARIGDNQVWHAWRFPMLTSALLWNRTGAQAWLDHVERDGLHMPIDNQLRLWMARTGGGVSLDRPIFGLDDCESTLPRDHGPHGYHPRNGLKDLRQKVPLALWSMYHQARAAIWR